MNSITNAQLTIVHDQVKKLAKVKVTCRITFGAIEHALMKLAPGQWFRLNCRLRGADGGIFGGDDNLFTITPPFFFPDVSPTPSESRTFEVTLGEGVLNEDWGTDEVYARLELVPLVFGTIVVKNTNTVSHSF
jgi:hypothetical protein